MGVYVYSICTIWHLALYGSHDLPVDVLMTSAVVLRGGLHVMARSDGGPQQGET